MKTNEITVTMTPEELTLLHNALCNYRARVGALLGNMNEFGLDDSETVALWNRIGALSSHLVNATSENAED